MVNRSKKVLLSVLGATLILGTPAAFANTVTNMSGTDGFSAVPIQQGNSFFHVRLDSAFPGNTLVPNIHVVSGIADGVDLGIGGGLSFTNVGIASPIGGVSAGGAVFPWIRAAIPTNIDNVKTGVLIGTSIPVNNNANVVIPGNVDRFNNEFFPGVTGLMDVYLGNMLGGQVPLTMGVNAGYARGFSSGTNLLSGNLNFTLPLDDIMTGMNVYEEQFVNYPVGGYSSGGVRVGLNVPVGDTWGFDLKPAALWNSSPAGTYWTFNPSLGISVKF